MDLRVYFYKKTFMKISFYIQTLALFIAMPAFAQSQDEGFLYGKVYTDDLVYEGPIRWGKEEVYWVDMFNAAKSENAHISLLSETDRETLEQQQRGNHSSWFENDKWFHLTSWDGHTKNRFVHQFSCQFGEIKSLKPTGSKEVTLEMKNGLKLELDGEGYNDVGPDIRIIDKELGELEVYWNQIDRIEFMDTPAKLVNPFGDPLYGTVEAFGKQFSGLIQWDHDERLSVDKLDGKGVDGSMSVEFGKIRSIEKRGNSSRVVLHSGREFSLNGSNDVSSGHRGVMVTNAQSGTIDIPWSEFGKITFKEKPDNNVIRYGDFKDQKELNGVVITRDGRSLSGKIVYDLDESHAFELLQGKEGEFEYSIPFHQVKRIRPNEWKSAVELINNTKLSLDEGQDVNEKNQGILVFSENNSEPAYLPWDQVSEIQFN